MLLFPGVFRTVGPGDVGKRAWDAGPQFVNVPAFPGIHPTSDCFPAFQWKSLTIITSPHHLLQSMARCDFLRGQSIDVVAQWESSRPSSPIFHLLTPPLPHLELLIVKPSLNTDNITLKLFRSLFSKLAVLCPSNPAASRAATSALPVAPRRRARHPRRITHPRRTQRWGEL